MLSLASPISITPRGFPEIIESLVKQKKSPHCRSLKPSPNLFSFLDPKLSGCIRIWKNVVEMTSSNPKCWHHHLWSFQRHRTKKNNTWTHWSYSGVGELPLFNSPTFISSPLFKPQQQKHPLCCLTHHFFFFFGLLQSFGTSIKCF